MSVPRTKRQFAGASSDPSQRQITSFFKTSYDEVDDINANANTRTSTPLLPNLVQSNLLSVGMRVRKSVPEGYKTGSGFGSFKLWSDADPPSMGPGSFLPIMIAGANLVPGSILSSRRELVPFCGIHKVGGLGTQSDHDTPTLPAAAFDISTEFVPDLDDVPSLTSSQESATSEMVPPSRSLARTSYLPKIFVTTASNRKRGYSDDGSELPASFAERPLGLGEWRPWKDWLDGEVSPRSWAPPGWENARVMAMPRRPKMQTGTEAIYVGSLATDAVVVAAGTLAELGQENMSMDDFDDAAFLDYRLGGEMDFQ